MMLIALVSVSITWKTFQVTKAMASKKQIKKYQKEKLRNRKLSFNIALTFLLILSYIVFIIGSYPISRLEIASFIFINAVFIVYVTLKIIVDFD